MTKEEFKLPREAQHLARLIGYFYIFRKSLQKDVEPFLDKRHFRLKWEPVHFNLPWGWKRVLGICIGLNLLKSNELFEERYLIKTIHNSMKGINSVRDSFFINEESRDLIHTLYIEVEKEDGPDFSLKEIRKIRHFLSPKSLKEVLKLHFALYLCHVMKKNYFDILLLFQDSSGFYAIFPRWSSPGDFDVSKDKKSPISFST